MSGSWDMVEWPEEKYATMWNSLRGIVQITKYKIPPPLGIGKTDDISISVSCSENSFSLLQWVKENMHPI